MVKCGVHLSNLALGSSKLVLILFRTKAVYEVFESEVVSAFKQATDAAVSVCRMELARPE
jgi:hypothetical protein